MEQIGDMSLGGTSGHQHRLLVQYFIRGTCARLMGLRTTALMRRIAYTVGLSGL